MTLFIVLYIVSAGVAWFAFYFIKSMEMIVGLNNMRLKHYIQVTIAAIFWPLVLVWMFINYLIG